MGSIINDLQTVFVRYRLDTLCITRLAINMYRHNRRCLGGYCRFYFVRVNVTSFRVNIHEYRLDSIPPQSMGGSYKAIRSCYHLTSNTQCLQSTHQRQCAVGEKTDIRHLQIFTQGFLQFLMIMTVIGQPLTIPDILKIRNEIVKRRK